MNRDKGPVITVLPGQSGSKRRNSEFCRGDSALRTCRRESVSEWVRATVLKRSKSPMRREIPVSLADSTHLTSFIFRDDECRRATTSKLVDLIWLLFAEIDRSGSLL